MQNLKSKNRNKFLEDLRKIEARCNTEGVKIALLANFVLIVRFGDAFLNVVIF